jgi:hypothetical protein
MYKLELELTHFRGRVLVLRGNVSQSVTEARRALLG